MAVAKATNGAPDHRNAKDDDQLLVAKCSFNRPCGSFSDVIALGLHSHFEIRVGVELSKFETPPCPLEW